MIQLPHWQDGFQFLIFDLNSVSSSINLRLSGKAFHNLGAQLLNALLKKEHINLE